MDNPELEIEWIDKIRQPQDINCHYPRGCKVTVKKSGIVIIIPPGHYRSELKILELAITLAELAQGE